MPPDRSLQDRYELLEQIGSGGMAEVWLARDKRLEREVAIKFLDERLLGDAESHVRFFSEAQAAARISHPHVVGVLDFGRAEETPYLVMEYVPSGTLEDLIGDPMDPDEALGLVAQAARGAGALHAADLVHRDLKPANMLLDRSGSVRVTDLGIAAASTAERMTDTGTAIGSPHYISPEQVSGKEATPASDVYSLGVVLYEALTGVKPFDGDNVTAIAIAHVEQEPESPTTHRPDLAEDVVDVVMRCLSKDPRMRFEDGTALAAAIASLAVDADGAFSNPAPIGVESRAPIGAVLVLLLLLAAGALVSARLGDEGSAVAGTERGPARSGSEGEAMNSPSPSPSSPVEPAGSRVAPVPSPSPSPEGKNDDRKDSSKAEPKDSPTPEEEEEPEPSPEPSVEASPEPEPTASPESAAHTSPSP